MKRFNLDFTVYQSFVTQLPGSLDVNFDIAYNRCAFMYKYTLCNMYFFKDCINKFLLQCTEFKNLVSKWTVDSNSKLCAMSCGPGLDYLSFMLALSEHVSPSTFKNITILSKHGAWRNTVGIVADALEEGALSKYGIGKLLNFKNIEVIQSNLLISIPVKGFEALQHSSVILMTKTLNLAAPGSNEEELIKTKLLELISSLKPEATIFCIDTKPSLVLFLEVLSRFHGKFLYKPDHLSFRVPITFSEDYKEKHGCFPVVCARGAFFVWQKLSTVEPHSNIAISPINILTDVKEISQNSLENTTKEDDEVLNITKTLRDLILPSNKNFQHNSLGNVMNDSHVNDNTGELISITSSPFNTPKKLEINKSSSVQTLLDSPSLQEVTSQVNFAEKNCSASSLKKSNSIDNSFFQSSSKNISFLEESDLLQNYPLYNQTKEETYPTILPHQIPAKSKVNESKSNTVPKSNQSLKSTLESKATQTELHQFTTNSSHIKDLTERVKRLVSSLENEMQKSISDGQMDYNIHDAPKMNANYTSCSTNHTNKSDVNVTPQCCNGYQTEREHLINFCNCAQMHHDHCCAVRHIHRCEMHCCKSCIYKCHINPYRCCENNTASTSTRLAQPQIVIPLQNVNNDVLLQIILAAKSGSEIQ
ncbi:hypothetical protein HNY73_000281 [Argiope bruennichi]|uniref:Uncharacterized protein n=1 Tax=Argiope bruennichi TaxID=94029 RepID=A0A8T0FXL5_ARGBR|nr:hypothetical protein HNY73_000281 [Argiope bruennichi]